MELIDKIVRLQHREAWTNCRVITGIITLGVALAFATIMLEQSSAVALVLWAPIGVFGLLVLMVTICPNEAELSEAVAGERSYAAPLPRQVLGAGPLPGGPVARSPVADPPKRVWLVSQVAAPRLPNAPAPSVQPPVPRPPVASPPISVDTPVPVGGFPAAPPPPATPPAPAPAPAPAAEPVAAAPAPTPPPAPAPEPAPEPAPAAEPVDIGTRPAALEAARDGSPDDLKKIKGVGPKLETMLHGMGFYHFDQIANWTADEVAWVDENLEGFKGRVTRDEWVAQAKLLAEGEETDFSKKVDDGDVY